MNKIGFQKLTPCATAPTKAHPTDAGYDLYSCVYKRLNSMERAVISTGICVEIPEGFYGRVAPRSGLAVRSGIDVLAGVIDSGYRGELGVVLINLAPQPFLTQQDITFEPSSSFDIQPGDRIAQLIIERHYNMEWEQRNVLEKETERSQEGFGSTGA
jgi:dUTP pyrophosphatase